jgi:hypothetical protein
MNNEKLVEQWRSACPVARTLDLLADRWSLLIVRDMLFGSSKFQQFLASPENIPTNVLSNRLKMLESTGLLTEKGKKLAPSPTGANPIFETPGSRGGPFQPSPQKSPAGRSEELIAG